MGKKKEKEMGENRRIRMDKMKEGEKEGKRIGGKKRRTKSRMGKEGKES